jgi:hypothetical protein
MLAQGLSSFEVSVKETDLLICASHDLADVAYDLVNRCRGELESFIDTHRIFVDTFTPIEVPDSAPEIVKSMVHAARLAGVGPMAAVAGAIAEYVGTGLLEYSDEIIIENGGDIFIKTNVERNIGIFAGDSPLSNKLAILVKPEDTPLAVCTSSGTVGHSVSFGKADAVIIMASSGALADATATKVGNLVQTKDDIKKAIEYAQDIPGIEGVIVIIGDSLGGWGKFEFLPV